MAVDVAGRLSEGFAALDHTQTYVSACAVRGYHHPDLTVHSAQVRDWYGTEDGLDLNALDADCVAMRGAAQAAAEALRCVQVSLDWSGEGGRAAIDFLARHGAQAERVAAAVDAAARSGERLRDELWRIVDGKVDATVSLDQRSQSSTWLPAAQAVIAGGSSSEEAAAVVDSEIRPFVETVVAGEWLAAMREAVRAVDVAYRAAVGDVASRPAVRFDIPGALGPVGAPFVTAPTFSSVPSAARGFDPGPALPTMPSNSTAPVPNPMEPMAAAPPTAAAPPMAAAAPLPAGAPASSGGDPLSAVGGLPGRFADAMGGLLGGGSGGEPALSEPGSFEPPEISDFDNDPSVDDPAPEDATPEDAAEEDLAEGESAEGEPAPDEPAEDGSAEGDELAEADDTAAEGEAVKEPTVVDPPTDCPDDEVPPPPDPAPAEDILPPEPVPAADPLATPCEIAADELPQVGQ
ncbi:hypothetical protein BH10ACT9_BH10ACT9_46570 [soil metagenome]